MNARGARSRTTVYVGSSEGSANAARWLPTPIAMPSRSAAVASAPLMSRDSGWPPVIPAIISGALSS